MENTEQLIDIVDNETGEIYMCDTLVAVAYLWSVQKGFRIVNDEFEFFDGKDHHGRQVHEARWYHWLYIEPKKGAEGDSAREMQYC